MAIFYGVTSFVPHLSSGGILKVIVTLLVGMFVSNHFDSGLCQKIHPDQAAKASVQQLTDQSTKSQTPIERLINALSGEWSAEEIYYPSDLLRAGGKGRSRESYRAGPARMSVIQEYHGNGVAGKAWGTGIIWWEAQVHGFHFVWCDSYALDRGCRVSAQIGKWDGEDFVQNDVHEVSGKQVFEKEVWSNFAPNSFVQTLYVGGSPDKLKRFMTISARRLVKDKE